MKTQHIKTYVDSFRDLVIPPEAEMPGKDLICGSMAKEIADVVFIKGDKAMVSFNRRPFKGAKPLLVAVNRREGMGFSWGRSYTRPCRYLYPAAQETLSPFFPKDGVYSIYVKVTPL